MTSTVYIAAYEVDGTGKYHSYLVWDSDGELSNTSDQLIIQGRAQFPGAIPPWGTIIVEDGETSVTSWDGLDNTSDPDGDGYLQNDKNEDGIADTTADRNYTTHGELTSTLWDDMEGYATDLIGNAYDYFPGGPNSNSVINTVLSAVGVDFRTTLPTSFVATDFPGMMDLLDGVSNNVLTAFAYADDEYVFQDWTGKDYFIIEDGAVADIKKDDDGTTWNNIVMSGYSAFDYDELYLQKEGDDLEVLKEGLFFEDVVDIEDHFAQSGGAVNFNSRYLFVVEDNITADNIDIATDSITGTTIHKQIDTRLLGEFDLGGPVKLSQIITVLPGQPDVTGSGEDEFIFGDDADNTLSGGGGDDFLYGGAGSDWVDYRNYISGFIDLQAGTGRGYTSLGADYFYEYHTFEAIENVYSGAYGITFHGNEDDNMLVAPDGSSYSYGSGGADTYIGNPYINGNYLSYSEAFAGVPSVTIRDFDSLYVNFTDGQNGTVEKTYTDEAGQTVTKTDTFTNIREIIGSTGNDIFQISETGPGVTIEGGDGVDTLDLSNFTQGVFGGDQVVLKSPPYETVLYDVGLAMERFIGTDFDDDIDVDFQTFHTYDGGGGNDTFDIAKGNTGNTFLYTGGHYLINAPWYSGTTGNNTIVFTDSVASLSMEPQGEHWYYYQDVLYATQGAHLSLNGSHVVTIENYRSDLWNFQFSDRLIVASDFESIDGTSGDDILHGDNLTFLPHDVIYGFEGNDILTGGAGDDELNGGEGIDEAVYTGAYADYVLTDTGSYLTVDGTIHGEGTDSLYDVEIVRFADGRYEAGAFIPDPVNNDPDAQEDNISVAEDGEVTFDPLANDSDVENDPLSVTAVGVVNPPANGTAVLNPDGTVTYTPNADYNGSDIFSYTVEDGQGGSATGTVNVTVDPVNDNPAAQADSFNGLIDQNVAGNLLDDNGNGPDSDIDGDALQTQTETKPTDKAGSVTIGADGTFTYTPATGFTGQDTFTYTLLDGNGGSAEGTVTIDVTATNGDDTLIGTSGDDILSGLEGNDTLLGGAGNDIYVFTGGDDTIDEEGSNDANDVIALPEGVTGDDLTFLRFMTGPDDLVIRVDGAGHGDITVTDQLLDEASQVETLRFYPDTDTVLTDVLVLTFGTLGADVIDGISTGASQDDTIFGFSGVIDGIYGGTGDDTVYGGAGVDWIDGGEDDDTLYGSDGNDTMIGGTGNDTLDGGTGDDLLSGNDGNDIIRGDGASTPGGDDTLYGGNGNDWINGGAGEDRVSGNAGTDVLYGGDDADTFVFFAATAYDGVDNIKDFSTVENDAIDISGLLTGYDPLQDSIDDFVSFTDNAGNSEMSVDRDGAGTAYGMEQIALIEGHTGLSAQDLLDNGHLIAEAA